MKKAIVFAALIAAFVAFGCTPERDDAAYEVVIDTGGSLQNPAWSPDGSSILFTRFRRGYNREPADLMVLNLERGSARLLVSDGSGNVNTPGAVWNGTTHEIVFSSSREPHDEIFTIGHDGSPGDEVKVTEREKLMAYEPSFAPEGDWIVFESHRVDVEDNGVITKYRIDGGAPYQYLTRPDDDCRQPNWSPAGDLICYQKLESRQWDIWVTDPAGTVHTKVTAGPGDKTDASFSPNGEWIVCSAENEDIRFANLFIIPVFGGEPVRVTYYGGYDGAPSWSPDGTRIAFESYPRDPDGSAGTTLWIIDLPKL